MLNDVICRCLRARKLGSAGTNTAHEIERFGQKSTVPVDRCDWKNSRPFAKRKDRTDRKCRRASSRALERERERERAPFGKHYMQLPEPQRYLLVFVQRTTVITSVGVNCPSGTMEMSSGARLPEVDLRPLQPTAIVFRSNPPCFCAKFSTQELDYRAQVTAW